MVIPHIKQEINMKNITNKVLGTYQMAEQLGTLGSMLTVPAIGIATSLLIPNGSTAAVVGLSSAFSLYLFGAVGCINSTAVDEKPLTKLGAAQTNLLKICLSSLIPMHAVWVRDRDAHKGFYAAKPQ